MVVESEVDEIEIDFIDFDDVDNMKDDYSRNNTRLGWGMFMSRHESFYTRLIALLRVSSDFLFLFFFRTK